MSQVYFLFTPATTRTNIAILFFALAIMVIFNDDIGKLAKRVLFIIFITSTIVSHYGATYVFLFILVLTYIGVQVISSTKVMTTLSDAPHKYRIKRGITPGVVALFLTIIFFWYNQMTGPTFSVSVRFIHSSRTGWAAESRGQVADAALVGTLPYIGVPQRIEFIFSWLIIIFIAIGVLGAIGKFKEMVFLPGSIHGKPRFLVKKFEAEYLVLMIACCAILVAALLLPYVSKYYGATRPFFQMMVPLSTFFVIGGIMAAKRLRVKKPHWLILAVLVPYFLSTTGVIGLPFNYHRTITLSSEGTQYNNMYISDAESYSAKWIKEYAEEGITIYTHYRAKDFLTSQGKIPYSQINSHLISDYEKGKGIDGYIYLRRIDIVDGGLVARYPNAFAEKSKVYANNRSEVYK